MNGTAHLRVRVRAAAMTTMTLKLAEAFAVRGVYAPGAGRLLHLRVINQNSLIVNLPTPVFRDNEFTLTVVYSGRLEPTDLDREAIAVQAQERDASQPHADSARAAIHLQQQLVLVSAVDGQRLRARHAAGHGADRIRRGGDGTLTGRPAPASETGPGGQPRWQDVRLPERSAGALSVVHRQPHDAGRRHATADSCIAGDFGDVRVAIPDPLAPDANRARRARRRSPSRSAAVAAAERRNNARI